MKKIIKIILYFILIVLVVFNLYILISSKTYIYKALVYNFVDIDDNDLFSQRKILAGEGVEWPFHQLYQKKTMPTYLKDSLEKYKSVAFVIIKNDSLYFEKYWESYSDSSISNSFSMAKSVVGILTGIAIDEGKIKSIDEPVADFIPEFKDGAKEKITIRHLLMMSSGLDWDESYASLFSPTTEAYYGTDLRKLVVNQQVLIPPGQKFIYQSGNTQLLGIVLEKATGKSLSEYASEKLWKPLHAMHTAEWSLDKENGREKSYCCFYSNARDFARFGSLYLHNGKMFGRQIVSADYVKEAVTLTPITDEGKRNNFYGYHWWIDKQDGHNIFYMRGILGQYVVVIPDRHIVFVRLGHKRPDKGPDGQLIDLPVYIKGVLEITND